MLSEASRQLSEARVVEFGSAKNSRGKMREVLLFGNGLGRSLNNEYFELERGLRDAWDDDEVLSEADRDLIRRCLNNEELIEGEEEIWPRGENELDPLQKVLAACDLVRQFEREDQEGWLTARGQAFPDAIRSFIHRAACYYHRFNGSLPQNFVNPLVDFILESRSHVATLNYDDLLYRSLGSGCIDFQCAA
ncbi:hypothetical protein [Rhodovulum marinum]|uniref:hypothetical protein n=1 Tax=Rhodovulum marinum TaxID=320662 RepID=UPI001043E5D0|nr:hypothetical protein [Rhodovulum marinum]